MTLLQTCLADYVAKGLSEIRDRIADFIESEYEDAIAELNLRIARAV